MEIKPCHKNLINDIDRQISDAWTSVNSLQAASYNFQDDDNFYNEEYDLEELSFKSKLERIHISLSLLLESLGYQMLLQDYKNGFAKFTKITEISMIPYVGEFHSDTLGYFWQYHKTISSLFGIDAKGSDQPQPMERFESILRNTPKIVFDRKIEPQNEADVRRCVYDVLIHVFPDTVREIPISQVTKTYKPDIGVKSLRAAAEYKYATTSDEAKKIIGGFYEDMRGYGGSEDWKNFYAVIYMTSPFFTIEQIEAEFKNNGSDQNWTPILVHGTGGRNRSK